MSKHTLSREKPRLFGNPHRVLPLYLIGGLALFFLTNIDLLIPSYSRQGSAPTHNSPNAPTTPEEASYRFPKKIWQSWKVNPLEFAERDLLVAKTWEQLNPRYRYEVLTDDNDEQYVEDNFGPNGFNRSDIISTYNQLTAKIIKADLLRYLVLYVEGGVYADIDVEALKPVNKFIPNRHNETDMDMIIGVEIDEPSFSNHSILGKKSQSFCQWTFAAKPKHPVMMRLVDGILEWVNGVAQEQNTTIPNIKLDFDQVISGTGPSAFTLAILAHMSGVERHEVKWESFHDLDDSIIVGNILVLTVEAFAAGQGHSDSGDHRSRHALVRHHYHASKWPKMHPRYSHPVYGEVENCNWDKECVAKWDEDTAAFNQLGPAEQDREIENKRASNLDIKVVSIQDQLHRIGL